MLGAFSHFSFSVPNSAAIKRRAADEIKAFQQACHLDELTELKVQLCNVIFLGWYGVLLLILFFLVLLL